MKKVISLLLVVVFVLAFSSVAFADARVESGAFYEVTNAEGDTFIINTYNDNLAFATAGDREGQIIIPTGDAHQNSESDIISAPVADVYYDERSIVEAPGQMD